MSVLRYANFRLRARLLAGDEPDWLKKHPRRSYILACVIATPTWCDFAQIRRFDADARELSRATGIPHVIDHVIPLTHPRVSGLNVPGNLQILTRLQNARKSNFWCEHPPQQFSLEGL